MAHERVEQAWLDHRRRVCDVAYRLLGSITEADDVAAETYARLLTADLDQIGDLRGWLVTVASRLCIDRLRCHEQSRRSYVGPWLPEPIVGQAAMGPEDRVTLDESVRMALLVVLEQLSPAERTAFVLHDVFALSFDEVGEVVGRPAAACRQLAHRARSRIAADAAVARFDVDRALHEDVVRRFARAVEEGDLQALVDVLAYDVVGHFDSGGVIPGAPEVELDGPDTIAHQLTASLSGVGASFTVWDVNGEPGVVVHVGGRVVAVISLGVAVDRIDRVHGIGNPAKLRHVQR